MNIERISQLSRRIVEKPRILIGRLKGLHSNHLLCCFTAKDLSEKPFNTIIDIGANKGVFINASKWVFPNSKIYAFEHLQEYYNEIKKIKGVTAFNFGLWDKAGEDIIYYNTANTGASSFLEPTEVYNKHIKDVGKVYERKAIKKRFDSLKIKIERPCFVKIDVEGAEDRVIKGFGERLSEVDVLQIEWFFRKFHKGQPRFSSLLPILEKYGFVGFIQREVNNVSGMPSVCDLIFFKEKKDSNNK